MQNQNPSSLGKERSAKAFFLFTKTQKLRRLEQWKGILQSRLQR